MTRLLAGLAPDSVQLFLNGLHASGSYSIADLAELFTISRPTVYRTFQRCQAPEQAL